MTKFYAYNTLIKSNEFVKFDEFEFTTNCVCWMI